MIEEEIRNIYGGKLYDYKGEFALRWARRHIFTTCISNSGVNQLGENKGQSKWTTGKTLKDTTDEMKCPV